MPQVIINFKRTRHFNTFLGDGGGLPRWPTTHLEHLQKGNKLKRNTILKLVTVFDTHALRQSSGQQQINLYDTSNYRFKKDALTHF